MQLGRKIIGHVARRHARLGERRLHQQHATLAVGLQVDPADELSPNRNGST